MPTAATSLRDPASASGPAPFCPNPTPRAALRERTAHDRHLDPLPRGRKVYDEARGEGLILAALAALVMAFIGFGTWSVP
jgi:hypothetical protein